MDRIRLIALDLDNTTLDGEGRLSPRTRAVIERALTCGVAVVVASGRSKNSLPQEVVAIKGLRYAITSNGAAVYDLREGQALHRLVLPEKSVDLLLSLIDPELELQVFVDGQGYASERYLSDPARYTPMTPSRFAYLKKSRQAVPDIRRFAQEHRGELDMFDLVLPPDTPRDGVIEALRRQVPGVYITTSMSHLIEIVHEDCGKRSGVAWLGERLGISAMQTAAFGDAENDRDMIEYAGLGCAVENAEPAVRAAANWVVPSHLEDGVAWGIERILDEGAL